MTGKDTSTQRSGFFALSPQLVLDSIESALRWKGAQVRSTGFIQALNSIENRVFETELENGVRVVAKFYRPNRWSHEQILEEHEFTKLLADAEIPAVAPLSLVEGEGNRLKGNTLAINSENVLYAIYPKVAGRLKDELTPSDVRSCAKYLAQMHNLGESLGPSTRRTLNVENFILNPLRTLEDGEWMSPEYWQHYESLALQIKEKALRLFEHTKLIRLHGDCHVGNVIWSWEDEPLFVDFDDMMIGPAVQDLWMMIRGREAQDELLRQEFIEAYSYFREFPFEQLAMIEVLRGMRMIHYSAWIAQRWSDPSFPHHFPNFGSPQYWQEELQALRETLEVRGYH